jgi:phage-related protein
MIAHIDFLLRNHHIFMNDDIRTKPVVWVGASRKDFDAFPAQVQAEMGYALYVAQRGGRHAQTKLLHGLGSGVVEVLKAHRGDAFRMIYTVRFASGVFVLHAFQKKSKSGISTPKTELDTVLRRLRDAERIDMELRS